jgi:hypothetical protein
LIGGAGAEDDDEDGDWADENGADDDDEDESTFDAAKPSCWLAKATTAATAAIATLSSASRAPPVSLSISAQAG